MSALVPGAAAGTGGLLLPNRSRGMWAAGPAEEAGNALRLGLVPYSQAKQSNLGGCKILSQQTAHLISGM